MENAACRSAGRLALWTGAPATAQPAAQALDIPVEYHTLENGLKVVLSEDHSVPTVTWGVYYGIGFRREPRNSTGFAHLFEHLMFQGSKNLGKGKYFSLVLQQGGTMDATTRFDLTNYFGIMPAHKTETILWAEADRMRSIELTPESLKNQQDVVKNEVKVNVLNQPYGGFPWIDLPQLANENWYNSHNFYGDLKDLDAATLDDTRSFFSSYYAPNNAVLVVAGDIAPAQTLAWIRKYFGDIPRSNRLVFPDVSEPRQEREKRSEKIDPIASQPALAMAYHMPARGTAEWKAMIVIDTILLQGEDSRLYQQLVQGKGFTGKVSGGINWPLGNAYNYNGPMLWSATLIHDEKTQPDAIIAAVDAEIEDLRTKPVTREELARAMTKLRSSLYNMIGDGNRLGLVDMLATFALFDDDPGRINRIGFEEVTPELIVKTAREYLRPTNRSIITLKPQPKQPLPGAGA